MFHCMNLVYCIFWNCLLVTFLVICVVLFFPVCVSLVTRALLFRKEVAIRPVTEMWLE